MARLFSPLVFGRFISSVSVPHSPEPPLPFNFFRWLCPFTLPTSMKRTTFLRPTGDCALSFVRVQFSLAQAYLISSLHLRVSFNFAYDGDEIRFEVGAERAGSSSKENEKGNGGKEATAGESEAVLELLAEIKVVSTAHCLLLTRLQERTPSISFGPPLTAGSRRISRGARSSPSAGTCIARARDCAAHVYCDNVSTSH